MSLIRGYTELRTEISQWRNQQLWRAGGMAGGSIVVGKPWHFSAEFCRECFILPDLFLDGLKRPFLRQLRTVSQSPEYSWEAGSLFCCGAGKCWGWGDSLVAVSFRPVVTEDLGTCPEPSARVRASDLAEAGGKWCFGDA